MFARWWKKDVTDIKKSEIIPHELTNEDEPKEEEWVWVQGYKGTDKNMQSFNNFQYELGKEYTIEGEPELCENGFHFCMTIEHTLKHYSWLHHETNRYFKVTALVKRSDLLKYGTVECDDTYWSTRIYHDKLVAKRIILIEEITGTELLLEAIKLKNSSIAIANLNEFKEACQIGYQKWYANRLRNQLQGKYSELFIDLLFNSVSFNDLEAKIKEALAYVEEGVSKDVAVYLLMKKR